MGFSTRNIDYDGRYPTIYVLKYLPLIGSIIVIGLWTFFYINSLFNQAILMDSELPVIEAGRFNNLLIWWFSTTSLCILTYFILIPISQKYHDSHTTPSECSDLFESAKSKMSIDFVVDLRVNREKGIVLASFRNPFKSLVVISPSTQRLILKEREIGEVIIAHELGLMKNYRPWWLVGSAWSICSFIALSFIESPYIFISSGLFEFIFASILRTIPFILLTLGMILSDYSGSARFDSELITSKEYQVSPLLARLSLLEGMTLKRSDIEKKQT